MRVTLVHSFYRSKYPSGENNAVRDQAQLLAEAGYEVTVVKRNSDKISHIEKPLVAYNVATFGGYDPFEEIAKTTPDLVHIHNLFPNFGSRWLKHISFPTVTTFHNFRPFCAAGTFMKDGKDCYICPESGSIAAIKNSCYQGSSVASVPLSVATRKSGTHNPIFSSKTQSIVLSEYAKDMFQRYGPTGFAPHVVNNFAYHQETPQEIVSGKSWVFVGRLSEEKGIEPLLESWPEGERIDIFGSGPLESELRNKYKELSHIRFRGLLEPKDRGKVLEESLGLLFPSTCRENSPLIVGEAYAAGIPIIAFAENVVGAQIRVLGGGRTFERFSELSASLNDLRANMAVEITRVKQIYSSVYSPSVWLDKIKGIYDLAQNNQAG